MVRLPDKNCILGDKLTAFAPHTTGIPFGKDKELEIIKQMFDCWTLLQEMDNYQTVSSVYKMVSHIELGYRGLRKEPDDCLKDTIDSCICIMGRGGIRSEEYTYYKAGINSIQGHIFVGRINGESATTCASEVMYLAANLLTESPEYVRIEEPNEYRDIQLKMKGIKKVSGLRNTNPAAYAYMVKSFQMLQEVGLYVDSIV